MTTTDSLDILQRRGEREIRPPGYWTTQPPAVKMEAVARELRFVGNPRDSESNSIEATACPYEHVRTTEFMAPATVNQRGHGALTVRSVHEASTRYLL